MNPRYKIIRFHKDTGDKKVISEGLTIKQAKKHCSNPETSSRTCENELNIKYTEQHGQWFDGYEQE